MLGDREVCFGASRSLAAAFASFEIRHMSADPDPVLDAVALDRLRESVGDEFVGELAATFLEDAPVQLSTLRGALERGDAEEAHRAAHTLKSNGATFGAQGFSELCRRLEDVARDGGLEGAARLLGEAEDEYDRVEKALSSLVEGRRS
jgi:HPt (histidine-containing phosphotransfer) domain-containing protein